MAVIYLSDSLESHRDKLGEVLTQTHRTLWGDKEIVDREITTGASPIVFSQLLKMTTT